MSNGSEHELFEFHAGSGPLLVSFPHSGTWIPASIRARMTESGQRTPDADWFLPRLYQIESLPGMGRIVSRVSRYVVDLNRPPDDQSLYPGQSTTGLCPVRTFFDQPIYRPDQQPGPDEIAERREWFWRPYHQRLTEALTDLVDRFGYAILLDAHSIASRVPMLFEGRLPDFNFGTNNGQSCSAALQTSIERFTRQVRPWSHVVNGRFIGGYITRHYGQTDGVQAVQLELSQATYMDEPDRVWDDGRAIGVMPVIHRLIQMLEGWSPETE